MRKLFGAARASVVLAIAFGLATVANAADACTEIREQADYVCRARGGEGAVREFVEWLTKSYQ